MRYTKKQIKEFETSTMIIYLIHNTKNRKNYVGQSTRTFNERYKGIGVGAERINRTNVKLQQDLEKFGPQCFRVTLLEQNVESVEKLNELEKYYIKLYDAATKGYNTLLGGSNYDKSDFYQIRRDIRNLYLQLIAIDSIIEGREFKSMGFYSDMVEIRYEEIGWDVDLHEHLATYGEYYKKYCNMEIHKKLQDAKDMGFNLMLQDVLEYYKL